MIDPHSFGLVEMALTGVIVLGFAFYQLWTVRDAGKKPDDKSSEDESAKRSGHPEG